MAVAYSELCSLTSFYCRIQWDLYSSRQKLKHWALKRLEQYLQTEFWSQHGGCHVGQFAGHPSPIRAKTRHLLQKKLNLNFGFFGSFLFYPKSVEHNVGRTARLSKLTVSEKWRFNTTFCHTCFWPTWLPPCLRLSVVRPGTRYRSSLFRVQWVEPWW